MMNSTLRMYLSLFVVKFKNEMSYRVGVLLASLMLMLYSVIGIFIWLAVYTFSHVSSIAGITLTTTLLYFVIDGALAPVLGPSEIVDSMYTDIKEGTITTSLIRPMNYFSQLIVGDIAMIMPNLVMVSIPVIVAVVILANLSIALPIAILFVTYVIFGYIIATLLGFIVGSLALYLTDIYGINVSLMWLTTIIGGGMLPLAFFPQNMQHILLMLPFAFLAYVPAGTLVGMLSASTAVSLLPIGVVWIAAFAVIAYFMWKRMSVRMNAVYI